jgi:hypothetical protein
MKKLAIMVAIVLMFSVIVPVSAAPLFSDVPEGNGWPSKEAVEAVAKLSEIGIFKGYPDGTFKGDRAATRWELALVVIRFYSEMEKIHATLATKQELEAAREEAKKAIEDTKTWVNSTFATKEELNAAKTELDNKITAVDQKLDKHVEEDAAWKSAHEQRHVDEWAKHDKEYAEYKATHQEQHKTEWAKHDQEFQSYIQMHDEEYKKYKAEVEQKFQQVREDMNKLREELKAEIDALGGRVAKLEEEVPKIDKRVAELERMKWHIDFQADYVTQGFTTTGQSAYQATPAGRILAANFSPYSATVGGFFMPVMDYMSGRPYTNGTGFTGKAGINIGLDANPRLDVEAVFSAYISQGDQLVDQIWGTPAQWLANANLSEQSLGGIQPQTNQPWTRMTFDTLKLKFYNEDKKADSKADYLLTLGQLDMGNFDKFIYAGILNPSFLGPKYYGGYGVDVCGKADFLADMHWQVLWTKIPEVGNASNYPSAFGFNLDWLFESGNFKLNFLRAASSDYAAAIAGAGATITAAQNAGFFHWINPSGYMAADKPQGLERPIPLAADGAMGAFGPQATTMWGASFNWKFEHNFKIALGYGNSKYWSNMQSAYTRDGNAFRIALGYAPENWDVNLDYISVEPWYDPMVMRYPASATTGIANLYWRLPDWNYFPFAYALHDTEMYPQNRQGFRLNVAYKLGEDGKVWAEYGSLQQQRSMAYDVNVAGVPTGFAPGFTEALFPVYNANTYNGTALREDNKGSSTNWGLGVKYQFPGSNLKIDLAYKDWKFKRDASLAGSNNVYAGASQNYVDLGIQGGHIGLAYPCTFNEENKPKFTLKGGYDWTNVKGHYDPYGVYAATINNGAGADATTGFTFDTLNTQQSYPYLGFDYEVNKDTNWGLNIKFINTTDGMGTNAGGANVHSFSWNGMQLSTEVKVKF